MDPTVLSPARVPDLLAALAVEEKIALLHQYAPAVPRLGMPEFRTGTEALHGLSWEGTATVFPQAVGLGATWDADLLRRVGDAVASEAVAAHASDPGLSLNLWAPVVNVLRHPLWGRNEEGFSEDPDVTAALAIGYCRGLRGDGPGWRTVPTLKHFVGYGNERDRSATSSHLPPQALREYELPAFIHPLAEGVVGAVMPSYNRVNGRPTHVSRELLDEMRTWAPQSVAVVSDAYAPTALVEVQGAFDDHVASFAAALRAGIDSFTDGSEDSAPTIERLTAALAAGLIGVDDIDRALVRVLDLRERAGALEPAAASAVARVDAQAHRALAREAARRSVVVLENDGILPLADPATIAVVGPFADRVALDWYAGRPEEVVTLAEALRARYPAAAVRVVSGADRVTLRARSNGRFTVAAPDGTVRADGIRATAEVEVESWSDDVVSLRAATGMLWSGATGTVRADASRIGGWVVQESFRLRSLADGAVALQHRGSGRWVRVQEGTFALVADAVDLEAAERFDLRVERDGRREVAQAAAGADVVVAALGNDPHIDGRETEDRAGLALPRAQAAIFAAAVDANPDTVLLLSSSYPYAVADEAERARGVVWSSHGGQAAGPGIVDILSGDQAPSGRLPQTWWRDAADAGDLLEYDVVGAAMTYRYADAAPLWGLGHGLSYAPVSYGELALAASSVAVPTPTRSHTPACETDAGGFEARVRVRNDGRRAVEELVLFFAEAGDLDIPAPRRRVAAWRRVALAPGEEREVVAMIDPRILAVWDVAAEDPAADIAADTAGAYRVQPGTYAIAAGGSAAAPRRRASLSVTGEVARARAVDRWPASEYHAGSRVVLAPTTPTEGLSVEVRADAVSGWARYDRLDLTGVTGVVLETAVRPFEADAACRVDLDVRAADGRWERLGGAAVTAPGSVRFAVGGALDAAASASVRLTLTGAVRVASLRFER